MIFVLAATYLVLVILLYKRFAFGMGLILGSVSARPQTIFQDLLAQVGSVRVYGADILYAVFATYLGFSLLQQLTRRGSGGKLPASFVLLAVIMIAAVVRGLPEYRASAIGESRWYVIPFLFFLVLWYGIDRDRAREEFVTILKIAIVVYGGFFLLRFMGFVGKLAIAQSLKAYQVRFTAAAETIFFAVLFLWVISGILFGSRRDRPKYLLPMAFLMGFFLVIMQHRSIWVGTVAGLATIAWNRGMRIGGLFKLTALAGVVYVLLLWTATIDLPFSVLDALQGRATFLEDVEADETASWRLSGWIAELSVAIESPVLGGGFGGYSEWYDPIEERVTTVQVHNAYIMYFSKFGTVGLVTLLSVIAISVRRALRLVRQSDPEVKHIAVWFVASLALMFTYAFFYQITPACWTMVAAVHILSQQDRQGRRLLEAAC